MLESFKAFEYNPSHPHFKDRHMSDANDDDQVPDDEIDGGTAVAGEAVEVVEGEGAEIALEGEQQGEQAQQADDADEVVITLGDEPESASAEDEELKRAPAWVKDLRKTNRELVRKLREVESRGAAPANDAQSVPVLPEKPTLASCEYDEEAFAQKLEAWTKQKAQIESQANEREAEKAKVQQQWQTKLEAHSKRAKSLGVRDYDDVSALVEDTFSLVQRAIIIDCAKDSAAFEYALGKSPTKLKELAAIQNPAHFTWAVAQLEPKLKITNRKGAPPVPESKINGSGPLGGNSNATLERLRAEADKTGDRSKVTRYIREQSRKSA